MSSTKRTRLVDETESYGATQGTDATAANKFANMEEVYEHLNGAGRYNLIVLVLMILCKAFPGMITLSPNFTAATMPFNCSDQPELPGSNCSIDASSETGQQCQLIANCSTGIEHLPCRQFTFRRGVFESTTVSRFSLVCDRAWLASLGTTFYFVGFLIGCTLYGALADRFGRKKVILASAVNLSLCTVAASFAPHLELYWALQLLAGVGNGGLLTSLYTFALENTDTKHRSIWGFMVHNGWSIGLLVFTLIAYLERGYEQMLLYGGLSVLLLLLVVPFLSESPRWLVSTGRFDAADQVLARISRINGRPLGPDFSAREIVAKSAKKATEEVHFWQLFSRPGIRKVTLLSWFIFFGVSMAYFGLSLSVDSLGSDLFVNQILLAIVEPPSRLFCLVLSYRLGRRASIGLSFNLAGLSLVATGLLMQWPQLATWKLTAAMIGKFWITMAFDLAWLYAAEVFPTVLRSLGVGSSSTVARAGALLSTLIHSLGVTVWSPLPFLLFAGGPLAAAALTLLFLPETRGQKLPDSLEEGELFASGRQLESHVQFEGPGYQSNGDVADSGIDGKLA